MFCLPYYKAFKGKGKLFVRKEMGMNTTNTECIALWSLPQKRNHPQMWFTTKKGQIPDKCVQQGYEAPSSLQYFWVSERESDSNSSWGAL